MKFRTRVSILLIILICIPAVFSTVMAVSLRDYSALFSTIYLVFVIPLLFGISYVIDGDKLYVRSFPLTKGTAYDLHKLVSITPTRTWLSAPASSLKRIKLDFGCGDPLVISPAAQDIFFEEILRVNPKVKIEL